MPYRVKYGSRGRRSYRSTNPRRRRLTGTVTNRSTRPLVDYANRSPYYSNVRDMLHKHAKKVVKDTVNDFMEKKKNRPKGRPMLRGATPGKLKLHRQRHEKLKEGKTTNPVNNGKGNKGKSSATGKCTTHPKSMLPKWKKDRIKEYSKGDVWQTVLLSKSSRIPTSNNILKTFRYPIKAPECLDSERVQTMVFSPFCSHWTGIHTTYYRNVRSDGTDLEHNLLQPLDVIQNKADVQRHSLPQTVDGSRKDSVGYEHELSSGGIVDGAGTQTAISLANNHVYYDQLLKNIKIDLVFMASRAFPVKISVTLVRHIKPTAPYVWSMDDKQQLLNNLDNRGLQWENYKIEYNHEFILPALRTGKAPPTRNIVKEIKTHFMQTNTFNEGTTADQMSESNLALLGSGLRRAPDEVTDGFVSGMCYVLIKYRKVQQPQQFTYTNTIDTDQGNGGTTNSLARIVMPVLTDESYDIPVHTGLGAVGEDGSPLSTDQGNESKASFYVHGTLKYNWGFREDTEAIPSLVSAQPTDTHFKKTQSLNIDPTLTGDNTNGIYTKSQSHVQTT